MKIENLRSEYVSGRPRVSATVVWEDNERPSSDVYFETSEEFCEGLTCNPNAFILGSIMPALRHGEKRIRIDADICPELREGLTNGSRLGVVE